MVFSSVTFLFYFLPVFMFAYFAVGSIKYKNAVLLVFSLIFYAWGEGTLVFLLLAAIAFNAVLAYKMDQWEGFARKHALAWAIGINLVILGICKYSAFVVGNLAVLFAIVGITIPVPKVHLPLGISFFTFHCISYLIDVYRRRLALNAIRSRLPCTDLCFHNWWPA